MKGLVIDLFAGGGGASTGIEQALGRANCGFMLEQVGEEAGGRVGGLLGEETWA